ncbi:MAG: lipopolysaccharide biosynthesis protein [Deltaproteobacteria bacterium]|nr:lipopolysaccharide biosynthesis protein [Deltaproteobacteria bacterium]MCK5543598.1 lipopolysaccharide biosynthesis protein [Desulfobulbaceae bacterium]
MSDGLKNKTLHALFWSFFERIGQQGVQFIISIILARLLLPEQFGLIAMLTIFMAIAQSFINSGFGQALIQKQDATHIDECSIFYFNILVGFFAAGLLCLAAPWIAGFYNQPLLVPLTYALSLNLIINAFGLVQITLLTKHIDFKTQLKVSVIATVISGTIGVTMAFNGFGVWSLVAQSLSGNLFRTALLWLFNTWRPSLVFSFVSLRGMFAFGSKLLCAKLIATIFNNIYLIVIGKMFSATDLGFYSRAKGLQQLPVDNISGIVSRVSFPVFSSVQDDKPRLKRGVRKALLMLAMVNFPLMIGLAVVARPLVMVLLTEKWAPCIPYLQLLCVVGILYPVHVINLNVLTAQGRSDLFFRLEILKKILIVIAISVTYRWGIIAMIYGQIVTSCLGYFLNAYYTGKMLDYPITEQIQDLIPSLALAGIMGLGVYALKYAHIANQLALLSAQIMTGIVLYAVLCYIFRISSFMDVIEMVKSKLLNLRYAN